ncbi:unnamed protein product [Owenia fusiformis]|uniref:Beta-chimaerin n=1 Tax=Owenia fusiformis TaxID=6347 RepID=A0A8S4N455_OWEFU|nr:unnamed protein product [Owenia fusiformis]
MATYISGSYNPNRTESSRELPVWKSYLYHLQQQSPKPKRIVCQKEIPGKPMYYGREFHGAISRETADRLLNICDGCYLVRESQRAPGTYTLALRFNGATKNFKLYYDGQHYVGEKRFDTIHDLVADGLITFYLELKAADYIAAIDSQSNYEESPYMAHYSSRKLLGHTRTPSSQSYRSNYSGHSSYTRGGDYQDNNQSIQKRVENENFVMESDSGGDNFEDNGHVRFDEDENTCHRVDDQADAIDGIGTIAGTLDVLEVMQSEKPHIFKTYTFKGPHWCDFCANFLWGLIQQGVKCQDCGFNAHKKCSEKVPNDCMPAMKYLRKIFGIDLTTLVKAQNTPVVVPLVVEKCIKEIESRGLEHEGIYRVAGFHDDVEAIRMTFDRDGDQADISRGRYEDHNTITSVLKLYFRLLPIPLITFAEYPMFIEAVTTDANNMSDEGKSKLLRDAVNQLPPAHYHTLKYLMAHLHRVTDKCKSNMMNAENLATVFAPTLLRSIDTDPITSLTAVKFEKEVIELLILFQSTIFDK